MKMCLKILHQICILLDSILSILFVSGQTNENVENVRPWVGMILKD